MNLAQVARLLSGFTLFFTVVLGIPLPLAWYEDARGFATRLGFAAAIGAGLLLAGALHRLGRRATGAFYRREGLAVVGLAWIAAGIVGAVPLWLSGALSNPIDAAFECISGLTTTGASVFGRGGNPAIEDLPASLLLWRALLQWIGGVGIILAFTVLLPAMGVVGKNLLASEAVGIGDQTKFPRMQEVSRRLFLLYATLTLLCGLGYFALGMPGFDALCHALSTMATGGFSTRNYSIGAYHSPAIEVWCTLSMFVAGCNFIVLLSTLRDGRLQIRRLLDNAEFRTYAVITATVIVLLTAALWIWARPLTDPELGSVRNYRDPLRCLRDASFQAVSILTSTGFCTADFQNWPRPTIVLLLLCMLCGGCTGSTAGGLKVLRALVCGKLVVFSLVRFIRPRTIQKIKVQGEPLADHVISGILTLLLLWLGAAAVCTLVLSLDPRLDPVSAFSTSVSMLGCTGPAITDVVLAADGTYTTVALGGVDVGPYGGFGDLHGWTKLALAIQMIFGRLEILTLLVLFAPAFWRR